MDNTRSCCRLHWHQGKYREIPWLDFVKENLHINYSQSILEIFLISVFFSAFVSENLNIHKRKIRENFLVRLVFRI